MRVSVQPLSQFAQWVWCYSNAIFQCGKLDLNMDLGGRIALRLHLGINGMVSDTSTLSVPSFLGWGSLCVEWNSSVWHLWRQNPHCVLKVPFVKEKQGLSQMKGWILPVQINHPSLFKLKMAGPTAGLQDNIQSFAVLFPSTCMRVCVRAVIKFASLTGLISACSVLKQCKDVELSFSDVTGKPEIFKGTKKGMLYLTPYRVSLMPAGLPLSQGIL